jgi:hypothetical protein
MSTKPMDKQKNTPLALRDIPDVEEFVTGVLRRLLLPLEGEESDRLVSAGIAAVFRIDRAVPRDQPLSPYLDGLLEQRLLELSRKNEREPVAPALRAA